MKRSHMLPHYRPDAINNEAGREKTKRGTSPGEAPADTTASSSKIRIAYLGCVNERGGGPVGGSKKWHRSRANINSSPKNHYAGGGITVLAARVRSYSF